MCVHHVSRWGCQSPSLYQGQTCVSTMCPGGDANPPVYIRDKHVCPPCVQVGMPIPQSISGTNMCVHHVSRWGCQSPSLYQGQTCVSTMCPDGDGNPPVYIRDKHVCPPCVQTGMAIPQS